MATTDRQATTLALAHALSAAERGLAVIPLSRTKLPALRSPHRDDPAPSLCHGACGRPGHGVYDASSDPARIRELFTAAPWATGYGIACGLPPHQLIGIDLDVKTGTDSSAALRELALRHLFTIPPTVVVLTPSGGRHLWLSGPPDVVVPNSAGRLAPASTSGRRMATSSAPAPARTRACTPPPPEPRTWRPPPARAPCCDCCSRRRAPTTPRPRRPHGHGQGLVQFVLGAHEGQRNTRLFWAACRAYEDGIGPALVDPLVEAALHTGLSEREARATIASAARMTGHRP